VHTIHHGARAIHHLRTSYEYDGWLAGVVLDGVIVIFEGVVFVAVAGTVLKSSLYVRVNGIESVSSDPCSMLNFLGARLLSVLGPDWSIGIHVKTLLALDVTASLAALFLDIILCLLRSSSILGPVQPRGTLPVGGSIVEGWLGPRLCVVSDIVCRIVQSEIRW